LYNINRTFDIDTPPSSIKRTKKMTNTKNEKTLSWRLAELPTAGEVAELVDSEVITKEEAREILFKQSSSTDEKVKALEEQLEFLQGLVKTLAQSKSSNTFIPYTRTITTPAVYWANTSSTIKDSGLTMSTLSGSGTRDLTLSVSNGNTIN
jgi:hypothetical protein